MGVVVWATSVREFRFGSCDGGLSNDRGFDIWTSILPPVRKREDLKW